MDYFTCVIIKIFLKYLNEIVSELLVVKISNSGDRLDLEICLSSWFINGVHPHI